MAAETSPICFELGNVDGVIEKIRLHFRVEKNVDYAPEVVREAFIKWFEQRTKDTLENAAELLTTPHLAASKEFSRMLEKAVEQDRIFAAEVAYESKADQYTGYRPFSQEPIAAVVIYLAYRCKDLYATKLNKLHFYADFSYFSVMRLGLTGARYVRLTHGPILDGYGKMLNELESKGDIRVREFPAKGRIGKQILPPDGYKPDDSPLTDEEMNLLDWVLDTYGSFSTAQIVESSHQESAYWESNFQQPIDYNYASSLKKQPPKTIIS
jgi:uncharacterized phage-associated protein